MNEEICKQEINEEICKQEINEEICKQEIDDLIKLLNVNRGLVPIEELRNIIGRLQAVWSRYNGTVGKEKIIGFADLEEDKRGLYGKGNGRKIEN